MQYESIYIYFFSPWIYHWTDLIMHLISSQNVSITVGENCLLEKELNLRHLQNRAFTKVRRVICRWSCTNMKQQNAVHSKMELWMCTLSWAEQTIIKLCVKTQRVCKTKQKHCVLIIVYFNCRETICECCLFGHSNRDLNDSFLFSSVLI